jgi:hypothetical protein
LDRVVFADGGTGALLHPLATAVLAAHMPTMANPARFEDD